MKKAGSRRQQISFRYLVVLLHTAWVAKKNRAIVYILFCWSWILLLWYSFLIFKIKASLKTLPLTTSSFK